MAACLRDLGHEVVLLCFKRFESRLVSPDDREAWNRAFSRAFPPVMEAHEEGTMFCPYLHPATDREWQLLLDKLTTLRPELVGVTLTTATLEVARELTARVHRELAGAPVVWGGIHPTVCPEESLQDADAVCRGEGEHTLAELCADPGRRDIAGLWRRDDGAITRNPLRPLEQELDRFPFASYGVEEWQIDDDRIVARTPDDKHYFRVVYTIMTQRGCPFSCTYCLHHVTRPMYRGQRYVRRRSVGHVLRELEQRVRQFDLPGVSFFDDVFVLNRAWIEAFADQYPRRIGLPFGGYGYPTATTEEMLRRLAGAGMVFLGMGIQTGSDYVSREIYGRRYGAAELLQLARAADACGLGLNYELLTNCPFETEADCRATLELMTQLPRPLSMCIKKLVVFPHLKIATLDKPRPRLPETTYEFWNQLYLMARHHVIAPDRLLTLSEDAYLKEHPEIVQAIALALKTMVARGAASRAEVDRLLAESRRVSLRGFVRCARRLIRKK